MFHALGRAGFKNREWHGRGGGDRGRDIVSYTYEDLPLNLGYERKWVFQCKKRKKMPSITEITNDMITAASHKPDFWILVLSFPPSSSQMDTIYTNAEKYLGRETKCRIFILAEVEEIISSNPDLVNVLYMVN
jgi:hypothetical protein